MKITLEAMKEIERILCERRNKQSHWAREDAMMELLMRRDKDMEYMAGVRDTLSELAIALTGEDAEPDSKAAVAPVKWEAD